MPDSNLLQVIKRIVKETVDAEKPSDYTFGTVVSANPLQIKISNTLTLDEDFLDLSRNVTDFETEVTISPDYGWSCCTPEPSRRKIKVHNSLKVGERVAMLRKRRGKRYLVIDRVVRT